MKEKKRALQAAVKSLETDIEEYNIAAEKENNLNLLTKGNSFRVTFVKRRKLYHLTLPVKENEEHKQI